MFLSLLKVIETSGLSGVDMSVRPAGDGKLAIMLSFEQSESFELKLLHDYKDDGVNGNADKVMALRAALNTPITLIASAEQAAQSLEQALTNLQEGVTTAATAYSALDINALLTKAATQAKAAKAAGKAPAKPEAKPADSKKTEPAKNKAADKASEKATAPAEAEAPKAEPEPQQPDFGSFDSL